MVEMQVSHLASSYVDIYTELFAQFDGSRIEFSQVFREHLPRMHLWV